MSATLMALALNPNLTEDQLKARIEQHLAAKELLWKEFHDGAAEILKEHGLDAYYSFIKNTLPIMFW
jgi:agmatine/peptidylarginine deiminase